ncbi:MAG: hypothetical protein J7M27_01480 [Candidatus Latescibacteria bacterium]|nr:hypothetical protein [Candidatus Latescibacterota bacterium]
MPKLIFFLSPETLNFCHTDPHHQGNVGLKDVTDQVGILNHRGEEGHLTDYALGLLVGIGHGVNDELSFALPLVVQFLHPLAEMSGIRGGGIPLEKL